MTQGLPVHINERWTFHLHMTRPLRFQITSEGETGTQLIVEGHDISTLLDYLYEHRDLIYENTHDQEILRLEALEQAAHAHQNPHEVRPVRYFYDGETRTTEE